MRKILCMALVLAMVLSLSACQGGGPPASPQGEPDSSSAAPPETSQAPSPPEPQSPEGGESVPAEAAMAEPDDLAVPIQIATEAEAPQAYKAMAGPGAAGTQTDLDFYLAWMDGLKGADVIAMYGCAGPVGEYTPGTMSLQDSQALFQKLKTIRPTLLSQAELKNPPTGGAMSLSIQTGDERAVLTFNGPWFVVYLASQNKLWVFDAEQEQVQDACGEIMETLSDNMNLNAGAPPPLYYGTYLYENGGEAVDSLYAVNTQSYVMARVTDYGGMKRILSGLQEYQPDGTNPDGLGFLVRTKNHRTYVYLDGSDAALTKSCLAALGNAPLHPSWIIHMNPGRIVSANGITKRQTLDALATFLKEKVIVQPETRSQTGPANLDMPAGLFTLKLEFDSGVIYDISGYDYLDGTGPLSIYTSDLDTTIHYKMTDATALGQYIKQLK